MTPYNALAVFDKDGRLLSHTQSFRSEVPLRARAGLTRAILSLRSAGAERQWLVLGSRRILVEELAGTAGGYVATVYPASRRSTGKSLLTPRQFEIAEYAAAGATATEIARLLDISAHTVRQHLKEVYRRLEVGSRVELSRILDPRGSTLPPARVLS